MRCAAAGCSCQGPASRPVPGDATTVFSATAAAAMGIGGDMLTWALLGLWCVLGLDMLGAAGPVVV